MPFVIRPVLITPEFEGDRWITKEPLLFYSETYKKNFVVPMSFATDLTSCVFWRHVAPAAAVLHDWLYANGIKFKQIKTRLEADELYFEALCSVKVPLWQARVMYIGVRIGGWQYFKGG